MVPVSAKNHRLLKQKMCINPVAIFVVLSVEFSSIFSYATATSYNSNLRLFLALNERKRNMEIIVR